MSSWVLSIVTVSLFSVIGSTEPPPEGDDIK
jgi:hypothetical protein